MSSITLIPQGDSPETHLWIAKINRHLLDLATTSKTTEMQIAKDAAYRFIFQSDDFYFVCDASGFEPSYVQDCARKIMGMGINWARRGVKKPTPKRKSKHRLKLVSMAPSFPAMA